MKRIMLLLLLLLIVEGNLSAQQKAAGAAPANGKAFMLDYYDKTFQTLKNSVEGLTATQLQFKPAPDRWSVSQCLEHIVLTERALFELARQAMEKHGNPERRPDVKVTDEVIIDGINDRSKKAKASDALTGKGTYNDPKEALDALQNDRKHIFEYINSTSIDGLRNHISDSPFGPIDAYQGLLFVAGHTSRHTLQIKEVMADKNFPAP